MPATRSKYEAKFKLQVVKFAEENNNCAAARTFNVNEKLVRDWRKNADTIRKMPKKKCANRGKTCKWPELESDLFVWVEEQRKNGLIVTRNQIRLKAMSLARSKYITDFRGGISWVWKVHEKKGIGTPSKDENCTKTATRLRRENNKISTLCNSDERAI